LQAGDSVLIASNWNELRRSMWNELMLAEKAEYPEFRRRARESRIGFVVPVTPRAAGGSSGLPTRL
jgi:hypothetical protein